MADPVTPRPWPRVKWTRAGQVAALVGPEGARLGPDLAPAEALAEVRDTDPALAIRFMAQALPRMEAARWMAACLQWEPRPTRPAAMAADKAVRRWIVNPSDEARRLAGQAGEAAGYGTAEGAACLAVFLSGGSLVPADQAGPVNPPPGAFGQALAGAVLLAAHAAGASSFPERAAAALALAERIAAGEEAA